MADAKTKAEDISERAETAAIPTTNPAPRLTVMAASVPARARTGSAPKRLSKGQRTHLRRLKQAGEIKRTPR